MDARDVDDPAEAALVHAREQAPGEPERRLEHQPVDQRERLGVELLDRGDVLDAGAVDQEVDLEVERVDGGAVGQVDGDVVAADDGGHLGGRLLVAVEHGDVGAELGEPGGDGGADAAGASGHRRPASVEGRRAGVTGVSGMAATLRRRTTGLAMWLQDATEMWRSGVAHPHRARSRSAHRSSTSSSPAEIRSTPASGLASAATGRWVRPAGCWIERVDAAEGDGVGDQPAPLRGGRGGGVPAARARTPAARRGRPSGVPTRPSGSHSLRPG